MGSLVSSGIGIVRFSYSKDPAVRRTVQIILEHKILDQKISPRKLSQVNREVALAALRENMSAGNLNELVLASVHWQDVIKCPNTPLEVKERVLDDVLQRAIDEDDFSRDKYVFLIENISIELLPKVISHLMRICRRTDLWTDLGWKNLSEQPRLQTEEGIRAVVVASRDYLSRFLGMREASLRKALQSSPQILRDELDWHISDHPHVLKREYDLDFTQACVFADYKIIKWLLEEYS